MVFNLFYQELKQKKREEFKQIAVFPCKLRIMPQHIFNSRGPIVVGVVVEAGVVKEGSPVTVPSKEVSITIRNMTISSNCYSFVFLRLVTFPSAFRNSKSHFIAEPISGSVNQLKTPKQQDVTGGKRGKK